MTSRRAAMRRGVVAAALLALGAAAFVTLRYFTAEDRVMRQVLAAAAPSVGRVVAISMSGRSTPMGQAFAVAPGTMAAACDGIRGNAQVVVKLGMRSVSARVDKVDAARNLCFLAVSGAASWPFALRRNPPGPGEKVFVALLAPGGELAITTTEVVARVPMDGGAGLALQLAVEPPHLGAPVLDREGLVVGMLASRDGRALALPAAWLQ